MKNNIKWIFFDIGGVLRDEEKYDIWRKKTLISYSKKFKSEITESDFNQAYLEASKSSGWLNQNILEILTGDKEKAEKIRNDVNFQCEKEKVLSSLPIMQNALNVVENLSKNYSLGIISNQQANIKDWLKLENLLDYFKVLGISGDYGLQKPNPEFFTTILNEANATFQESVMIDDNIERSLLTAKQLGITTVFFNNTNRQDIPKNIVDFTIYSLTDLLKIF